MHYNNRTIINNGVILKITKYYNDIQEASKNYPDYEPYKSKDRHLKIGKNGYFKLGSVKESRSSIWKISRFIKTIGLVLLFPALISKDYRKLVARSWKEFKTKQEATISIYVKEFFKEKSLESQLKVYPAPPLNEIDDDISIKERDDKSLANLSNTPIFQLFELSKANKLPPPKKGHEAFRETLVYLANEKPEEFFQACKQFSKDQLNQLINSSKLSFENNVSMGQENKDPLEEIYLLLQKGKLSGATKDNDILRADLVYLATRETNEFVHFINKLKIEEFKCLINSDWLTWRNLLAIYPIPDIFEINEEKDNLIRTKIEVNLNKIMDLEDGGELSPFKRYGIRRIDDKDLESIHYLFPFHPILPSFLKIRSSFFNKIFKQGLPNIPEQFLNNCLRVLAWRINRFSQIQFDKFEVQLKQGKRADKSYKGLWKEKIEKELAHIGPLINVIKESLERTNINDFSSETLACLIHFFDSLNRSLPNLENLTSDKIISLINSIQPLRISEFILQVQRISDHQIKKEKLETIFLALKTSDVKKYISDEIIYAHVKDNSSRILERALLNVLYGSTDLSQQKSKDNLKTMLETLSETKILFNFYDVLPETWNNLINEATQEQKAILEFDLLNFQALKTRISVEKREI